MTKHTPGPRFHIGTDIFVENGDCLPETEANARLIAAAPEMLHALKMCEEALRAHMAGESQHVDGAVSVDIARAAIAKATGDGE